LYRCRYVLTLLPLVQDKYSVKYGCKIVIVILYVGVSRKFLLKGMCML
jgi:hypothetical protein